MTVCREDNCTPGATTVTLDDCCFEWCPNCNGYGSSLREASDRCSRCGGSGLVKRQVPVEEKP